MHLALIHGCLVGIRATLILLLCQRTEAASLTNCHNPTAPEYMRQYEFVTRLRYKDVHYFLLKIHQHCGLLNPRLST
jgi:hypothetical protein